MFRAPYRCPPSADAASASRECRCVSGCARGAFANRRLDNEFKRGTISSEMPLRPKGESELTFARKGRRARSVFEALEGDPRRRKTRSLRLAVLSASYGRIERIVPRLRSVTSKTSQTDSCRSSNRLTRLNSCTLSRIIN